MDRGTGGALGPIFRDGTFEYVPIPELVPTRCKATYATTPGRRVSSLAAVLPARVASLHPHLDPDFRTATYGDAAPRKRRQLLRLGPRDLLVFYAGLVPRPPEDRARLFAIGSLRVREVHHLRAQDFGRRGLQRRFGETAHFLRRKRDQQLALVEGELDRGRLFARAIPLGDTRDCLLRDLACLGYQGSLLRAVGHWIEGAQSVHHLDRWLGQGPASLVAEDTNLVPIAAAQLVTPQHDSELAIETDNLREGDWIVTLSPHRATEVQAFGRINRVASGRQGKQALSSLFWFFPEGGAVLGPPRFPPSTIQTVADSRNVRVLVSWFARRYRIGAHHAATIAL